VIDGINEDENPGKNLQAICQFITRYSKPAGSESESPSIKVVFSFRSAFFDKTLRALGYANEGDERRELFPTGAFFTHEVEAQGQFVATHRFTLERVTLEEAEAIYEGYRTFEGIKTDGTATVRSLRPLTPFSGLNPTTRHLLNAVSCSSTKECASGRWNKMKLRFDVLRKPSSGLKSTLTMKRRGRK
jgi:hypothetical protein